MENKNKIQKLKKENTQLNLLLKGQEINQKELRLGFIGLGNRCRRIECAEKRTGRVKKHGRIENVFQLILKCTICESEGPGYIATRTRIALCLLTVTGIRIGELLPLLKTLLEEG